MFSPTSILKESIVTDGLVLWLDANDKTSYPGSGNTWNDLTINSISGTFNNGPTYSNTDGGSITFDGTNDYISIPYSSTISLPDSYPNFTVEIALKAHVVPVPANKVFLSQAAGGGTNRNWVRINNTSQQFDTLIGNATLTLTSLNPVANTVYVINLKYESGTMYIGYNGVFYQSASRTADENATGEIRIGASGASSIGAFADGDVYFVRFYNRALTSQEVLQNYNATKGRFGF